MRQGTPRRERHRHAHTSPSLSGAHRWWVATTKHTLSRLMTTATVNISPRAITGRTSLTRRTPQPASKRNRTGAQRGGSAHPPQHSSIIRKPRYTILRLQAHCACCRKTYPLFPCNQAASGMHQLKQHTLNLNLPARTFFCLLRGPRDFLSTEQLKKKRHDGRHPPLGIRTSRLNKHYGMYTGQETGSLPGRSHTTPHLFFSSTQKNAR